MQGWSATGDLSGETEQPGSEQPPLYLPKEEKFCGGLLVGQEMNFVVIKMQQPSCVQHRPLPQEQTPGCGVCSSGTAFQEMALRNGARHGDAELQQDTEHCRALAGWAQKQPVSSRPFVIPLAPLTDGSFQD